MKNIKTIISRLGLFWSVFLFALILRLIYLAFDLPDYWGDAFHSVFISKLTVENNWVYSDYTGREVVWLPFYRYLVTVFMFIFDHYNLLIPHLVNILLGSLACAMVAKLVGSASNKNYGIIAGAGLAMLPWHIAYSNLNSPEVLGGVILLSLVTCHVNNKWIWLAPLAFIGVLTRNELTPIMTAFGVFLIYRREWKSSLSLLIGGVAGLTLWGLWCYYKTGYFFWWIAERSIGSAWNHIFQMEQGRITANWYAPLLSILQAFPYILIIIFYPKILKLVIPTFTNNNVNKVFAPTLTMLSLDWIFVFFMQFRFYPYPEPKYFMMTLPLACTVLGIMISQSHDILRKKAAKTMMIVGTLSLLLLSPTFFFLHYSGYASKTVGMYIKENIPPDGNIWMDYTVAWYYSGLSVSRMHSSYTLASRNDRYETGFEDDLRSKMQELDIRYVMSQPASYTYVYDIWPEMNQIMPFDWKGLRFEPVFSYIKPTLDEDASITERIINLVITDDTKSTFWKITYSNQP